MWTPRPPGTTRIWPPGTNQVRNALRERGIADSQTQAIRHADTKDAIVGDGEASQAHNRRVDVLRN
jgi:outer membrane protein OmpA-like peptidoglycan-associated protein